jgi:hypothetical protein
MDARDALIQILQENIADLNQEIRDANDWYDKMRDVLNGGNHGNPHGDGLVRQFAEECYTRGYGRHMSHGQFNNLISYIYPRHDPSAIYYITMSRIRAGIHIQSHIVSKIHWCMRVSDLIEHMLDEPAAGAVNLNELCLKIGHPKELAQRGCDHMRETAQVCDTCLSTLRDVLPVNMTALLEYYVPDATLEYLRGTDAPPTLLDVWQRKNAKFRAYGIQPKITRGYKDQ